MCSSDLRHSASSDKRDDFELVPLFQDAAGVLATRDQHAIAFDREVAGFELEFGQQRGHGLSRGNTARLAVDENLHEKAPEGTEARS